MPSCDGVLRQANEDGIVPTIFTPRSELNEGREEIGCQGDCDTHEDIWDELKKEVEAAKSIEKRGHPEKRRRERDDNENPAAARTHSV